MAAGDIFFRKIANSDRLLERIPEGAALIAARHQSAFDTFVWMTLLPRCCYVVQELLRIPLLGKVIIGSRMIVIDRAAGSAALCALLREGDRAVHEARQIVIFPEGTRSEPGSVRELRPGVAVLAARTKLPIIPVATDLASAGDGVPSASGRG